jgi:hypothetical protein
LILVARGDEEGARMKITRTLESAREIVESAAPGQSAFAFCGDADRLGCSVEEHEAWLRTAPTEEIRAWALSCEEPVQVRS